jgi:hypothetical protein
MITVDGPQNQPKWYGFAVLLLLFLGLTAALCTAFALVVTVAQAWVEHTQVQWPKATARVQRCGVDFYTHKPEAYWINCSISYAVQGEEIMSHVHSRSTRQFDKLQEWADEHPEGTSIVVHYDPAHHKNAVLVRTDMPSAGPRTPDDLRLLGFFAVSCAVLLTAARIVRGRATAADEH